MDIVLEGLDNHGFDSLWAWLLPLRIPISDAQRAAAAGGHKLLPSASASAAATLKFLQSALPTTASSSLAALGTLLPDPQLSQNSQLEQWTTVSAWPRDDWRRQTVSLTIFTLVGIHIMYFLIAGASYKWLFDHRMMQHPRFIKGQIRMEIKMSLIAFPTLTALTVPWFIMEVRGWSMCYENIADGPWGGGAWGYAYLLASAAFFLWFTDLAIYFVHRWEHHPSVYKRIHKPHHRWVIPTPWASHAFHPLDGYAQSLPYHIFIFLFPLHKMVYLGLFLFVNLWTILIHDSDMIVDHPLENVINGPAHHTLHHLYFTCNYGQYFTWADKYWDSYRQPAKGDDPLLAVIAKSDKNQKQRLEDAKRQEAEQLAALSKAEGQNAERLMKDMNAKEEAEEKKDR